MCVFDCVCVMLCVVDLFVIVCIVCLFLFFVLCVFCVVLFVNVVFL